MKKTLAVLLAVCSAAVLADTYHWTGQGHNSHWTNANNWAEGKVPGRYKLVGSSEILGQTGDVAVFGSVNAPKKYVTCAGAGLYSIAGIKIVGDDPEQYTIGQYASDYIQFEPVLSTASRGDYGLVIDASVVNMPVIMGRINPGIESPQQNVHFYIENNAEGVLDIPGFEAPTQGGGYTGYVYPKVWFVGSTASGIRLNGGMGSSLSYNAYNLPNGEFIFNADLPGGGTYGKYAPVSLYAETLGATSIVRINEGFMVYPRTLGGRLEATTGDLKLTGGGLFRFPSGTGNGLAHTYVGAGRTLTIDCQFSLIEEGKVIPDENEYWNLDEVAAGGTVRVTGNNCVTGSVLLASPGTLEASSIGAPGIKSNLGLGRTVCIAANGILKYTGAGEETTRPIAITNNNVGGTSKNPEATLCHAGTGSWTVSVFQHGKPNVAETLTLTGERDDAVLSAALTDNGTGAFKIIKKGTGTWALTAPNAYTGATRLEGGLLKVAKTSSISSVLNGNGGSIEFEGDDEETKSVALATMTVASDLNVKLTGKTTLTVQDLVLAEKLNFQVGEDAKVVIDDADFKGKKNAKITWNGYSARIGEDGEVTLDADVLIAARGDVVPDGAGAVALYYPGAGGDDTLEKTRTQVDSLALMAAVDSTVAIDSDQELAMGLVRLEPGSGNLTLGVSDAPGFVTNVAANATLGLVNFGSSTLTLNAGLAFRGTESILEAQGGKQVFAGAEKSLGEAHLGSGAGETEVKVSETTVTLGTNCLAVGYASVSSSAQRDRIARLVVEDAEIRNADVSSPSSYASGAQNAIVVGHNAQGVLQIEDGAAVVSKLLAGGGSHQGASSGWGAVVQNGGAVAVLGSSSAAHFSSGIGMGGSAQGYYEMQGGEFDAHGLFSIGGYGTGIWHQFGGRASFGWCLSSASASSLYFSSGNGGASETYLAGGTMETTNYVNFVGGALPQNRGTLSIVGPDAFFDAHTRYFQYFSKEGCTGLVCVAHGGTIRTGGFCSGVASTVANPSCGELSFDGGILRPALHAVDLFNYFGDETKALSAVTVYGGGMTVDVDGGLQVSSTRPIRKASGKGVASIPFDLTALPTDLCTPPGLLIEGDGHGAIAHFLFDSATKTVTNVVVTCPGSGYTRAKAKAYYGSWKTAGKGVQTVDCVLADNDTKGSFTKAGAGQLTLSCENTWGGDTVLAGGTLKAGVAGAIPSGSTVALAGGTLDMNGQPLPTAWAIDAADAATAGGFSYPGELVFPAGSTLVVRNDDQVPEGKSLTLLTATGGISGVPAVTGIDESKWHVSVSGNRLRLGRNVGMMLLVR